MSLLLGSIGVVDSSGHCWLSVALQGITARAVSLLLGSIGAIDSSGDRWLSVALQGITGHELCHYFWDPSVWLTVLVTVCCLWHCRV